MEKISETKGSFFEKINSIDKHLVKLTKENERRHKLPISGMKQKYHYRVCRHQKDNKYYEQLNTQFDNIEDTD